MSKYILTFFFQNQEVTWLKIMKRNILTTFGHFDLIVGQKAPFLELGPIRKVNYRAKWLNQNFSKICYNRLEYHEKMYFEHAWLFRLESAWKKKHHKYIRIEIVKMSLNSYCITLHIRTKGILSPCMLYKTPFRADPSEANPNTLP